MRSYHAFQIAKVFLENNLMEDTVDVERQLTDEEKLARLGQKRLRSKLRLALKVFSRKCHDALSINETLIEAERVDYKVSGSDQSVFKMFEKQRPRYSCCMFRTNCAKVMPSLRDNWPLFSRSVSRVVVLHYKQQPPPVVDSTPLLAINLWPNPIRKRTV